MILIFYIEDEIDLLLLRMEEEYRR